MPTIEELKENLSEIQGNVIRGYRPSFAVYLFYQITSPVQGRKWLATLLDAHKGFGLTTSARWSIIGGVKQRPPTTLNIGFSHRGLAALGLSKSVLESFPEDFKAGMAKRAVDILGDEPEKKDKKIPKNWEKDFRSEKIAALLIVTTSEKNDDELQRRLGTLEKLEAKFPHVSELRDIRQYGSKLSTPTEHFGYADGISQPFLEGTRELFHTESPSRPLPPFKGQGTPRDNGTWVDMKPGEFILGYEDEFGEVAMTPHHHELRKNGTYLVFRKLDQDVQAFQSFLKKTSQAMWRSKTKGDSHYYEELLAAKLMGRWRSGCPLLLSPVRDNTNFDVSHPLVNNDFLYAKDPHGEQCPLGSHIRRTNPRDDLLPAPTDFFDPGKSFDIHLNRHRIIRRGITYGPPYTEKEMTPMPRGVIFMALNSSISRQFEFLQQQWVNKGGFLGLDDTDRDPIIGKKDDGKATVTVPGTDKPFVETLQPFVTEKGGEYFFYPSLTALRGLAEESFNTPQSFLSDYEALESISHPVKGPIFRQQLVSDWLIWRAKDMFKELLQKPQILLIPPVNPPRHIPDLEKPALAIATKYDDVVEILKDKNNAFSVDIYSDKMLEPRGPFILGMEHHSAQYKRELGILKKAIKPTDLEQRIRPLIERLASEVMKPLKPTGTLDVIEDLAWTVPLRLNRDYFGVSGPNEEVLKKWCRDVYTDIFLNLRGNEEWMWKAKTAVTELNTYLDSLIESKHHELQHTKQVPDTVLARLIHMQHYRGTRFHDGLIGVRRNIFGIVIGVIETTLKAVSRTVDQFLQRKDILELARKVALNTKDKKLEEFSKLVFEAMRFNPQNHVLFRKCKKKTTLAKKTDRKTVIQPGTLVFAGTLGAMFDPDKVSDPDTFNPERPADNYLFFGHEHHNCLGEQISRIQIPILVKEVVTLKGLRRPGEKGGTQFHPLHLLPEHYYLEFDPIPSKKPRVKGKGRKLKK